MKQHPTQLKALTPVPGALVVALILSISVACNQASSQPSNEGSTGATNGVPALQAADATAT